MIVSPIRQAPLGEQLLVQLRALIVRGELTAGTHLVEGWIAERFGVSRGPVRDALRQLELEGLVETRRRGVYVRGLSDTDLAELYALRGALESLAVRESIARLPGGDWSGLHTALDRMWAAADAGDSAAFAAADLDFHGGFYAIGVTAGWPPRGPPTASCSPRCWTSPTPPTATCDRSPTTTPRSPRWSRPGRWSRRWPHSPRTWTAHWPECAPR